MCGIVGYLNLNNQDASKGLLNKMNQLMYSRGPDDEGYFLESNFGMAMRRLSIIDLKYGSQPIYSKDKSKVLIFNGEIYNYVELRESLEKEGVSFRTNSDSEVIIELFEKHGYECLKYLNGMFAICIWDSKNKNIFLARDRLGIKPLFYYKDENIFIFSSSLNSLKIHPSIKTKINHRSLLSYFSSAYIHNPDTIYENILKLKPGHSIIFRNNELIEKRYWKLNFHDNFNSKKFDYEEYIEKTKFLLNNSIKINSRSDVKIGTFLSGGLDSSYITKELSSISDKKISTFTAYFPSKKNDERELAKKSAKIFNTEHYELEIDKTLILNSFNDLIPSLDEPIADSAIIPSYLLSKLSKENNVKVILTGAGGDELFGGYHRYYRRKKDLLTGIHSFLPVSFISYISSLFGHKFFDFNMKLYNKNIDYAVNTSGLSLSIFNYCLNKSSNLFNLIKIINEEFNDLNVLKNKYGHSYGGMLTDLNNYLVDDILSLTDKTSMSQSVEIRVPFLDHRLVEQMFSIPEKWNIKNSQHKYTFKKIIDNKLPPYILENPKTGFNGPVLNWFDILYDEFTDVFNNIKSPIIHEIFDCNKIINVWNNDIMRRQASEFLFMIFVAEKWLNNNE